MTTGMRAVRLLDWQGGPTLTSVDVPEPGPGQVLLRVAGAGVCHSDLHVLDTPAGGLPLTPPFTLGHEAAGTIAALGPGVTGWAPGDAVALYAPFGCGTCEPCERGEEQACRNRDAIGGMAQGLGFDGAMAEYVLVPFARNLVALGDLDPVLAAPLTDAALTPYHAIKRALAALPAAGTVVVLGYGGLGHLALQLLQALSTARVVVVDRDPARVERAVAAGASAGVVAGAGVDGVRAAVEGAADLVLDLVGSRKTTDLATRVVARGGQIAVVGLAGGSVPVGYGPLPQEVTAWNPYWGSRSELVEVIDLARRGLLRADVATYPLDDVARVIEMLRAGEIPGRAVLVPGA